MTLRNIKPVLYGMMTLTAFLLSSYVIFFNSSFQMMMKEIEPPQINEPCPGVLSGMMTGYWKTRHLTEQEQDEMFAFLFHAHSRYSLPPTYQRNDSLCGNVTYLESKKFRALCDPKGKTPCCFHNKCALKTVGECECEDCYDMRNMKHAEYSTWIPSHPGCRYHEHTPEEACDILDGMDIAFVGDSLVRHVYTAMLLLVTGNMKDGAMNAGAAKESRRLCQGMNMFTEKVCRLILKPSMDACNGTVKLSIYYYFNSGYGPTLQRLVKNTNTSLIITGIGVHDDFDHDKVQGSFLAPTLSFLKNESKKDTKILWAAHHAPGILKSPIYLHQTDKKLQKFNRQMESFLKPLSIPIFDTYRLTEGMMSFDGEHYGMGINRCKANLLLSYIKEQNTRL